MIGFGEGPSPSSVAAVNGVGIPIPGTCALWGCVCPHCCKGTFSTVPPRVLLEMAVIAGQRCDASLRPQRWAPPFGTRHCPIHSGHVVAVDCGNTENCKSSTFLPPLSSIANHHHYPNSKTSRNEAKSTFLFLSVFLFQLFCVSRFSGRSGEVVSVEGMKRGGDIGDIGGMQPLFDLCSSAIDVNRFLVRISENDNDHEI